MELSPTHSGEKSIPVNVLMSQWWISRAMKTAGQSDAKINSQYQSQRWNFLACVDAGAELTRVRPMNALVSR